MRKCETRMLAAALALAGAMMGAITGAALGLTAQQEQAACQDDAMRLCSAAIPDEGRINSCPYQYRASISPPAARSSRPPKNAGGISERALFRRHAMNGIFRATRAARKTPSAARDPGAMAGHEIVFNVDHLAGAGDFGKILVVFCDGTWNRADQSSNGRPCPTNVLRLFEACSPENEKKEPQIAHYVEGIGTQITDRLIGGMFGYGISADIENAYSFIASNYEQGDKSFYPDLAGVRIPQGALPGSSGTWKS